MPNDEGMDPKRIVEQGYDIIADRYAAWAAGARTHERERYMAVLEDALPPGAAVLDLGCGTGVPVARRLSERFAVTGVDLSSQHVEMARRNVPAAAFMQADMTALAFTPGSFDAITAFYSITHVPRDEHAALLRSIVSWLRSGGLFVAALGHRTTVGEVEDDWLGVPMYFSHFDSAANRRLVEDTGLQIVSARAETADEDGVPVTFLWIVARKPQ